MSDVTPMMRQYLEIKAEHPDAILFFRLGDFYEMFLEDAVTASKILDITLTSRNKNSDGTVVPMCGIPFHSAAPYLAKLVGAGQKVAICEQAVPGSTPGSPQALPTIFWARVYFCPGRDSGFRATTKT